MAAKKLICYPFDVNGDLLNYTKFDITQEEAKICYEKGKFSKTYETRYNGCKPTYTTIEWRPNTIFEATLELKNTQKNGCSAKDAIWVDTATGKEHQMFIVDVLDLIRADHGFHLLSGKFTYVKRGANFAIKWVNE